MVTEQLNAISRWLNKQHVVSYCVAQGGQLWCANAFYIFSPHAVAFYLMSDTGSRHGQMIGECAAVAGTVSGQPKTVAIIRGIQFRGEIKLLGDGESEQHCKRFPLARLHRAPMWEITLSELKFTDNTLGFGSKISWRRE